MNRINMNTVARALLGAGLLGAAGLSMPARAVTGYFSPGGAVTASGAFNITKGTSQIWQCNIVANMNFSNAEFTVPPAANIATVNSVTLTPGNLFCNTETEVGLPWAVQLTSGYYNGTPPINATSVNLTFLNADFHSTVLGDCTANLNGVFDPVAGHITIPATPMTGTNPAAPCHFHGPGNSDNNNPVVLTVSPSQRVVVTAP